MKNIKSGWKQVQYDTFNSCTLNLCFLPKSESCIILSECWSRRSCSTSLARGPRSEPPAWRPAADAQTPRRSSPGSPPPRQARWTLRHHEATFSWTCSSAVRSESEEEKRGRREQQSWRKGDSHTVILWIMALKTGLSKESHGVWTVSSSAPRLMCLPAARLAAT